MGVDVHVGDPEPPPAQRHDREHGVVDVAEPGGTVRHGVVEAAREVERAVHFAFGHQLRGENRAAGRELGGLPQAGEDRVVAGPQAIARRVRHPVAGADRAEDVDVLARVEACHRLDGGGVRRHHLGVGQRGQPVGVHETPGQPEPLHAQGMLRSVVEAAPVLGVDDGGAHG
jgi:hypothetical protein